MVVLQKLFLQQPTSKSLILKKIVESKLFESSKSEMKHNIPTRAKSESGPIKQNSETCECFSCVGV